MYLFVSFVSFISGKKEPGFAKFTLQVPGPEPTEPVVTTDVPTDATPPSCSISPTSGTVLDAFDITCKPSSFCSAGCFYCFRTNTGENVVHCNLFMSFMFKETKSFVTNWIFKKDREIGQRIINCLGEGKLQMIAWWFDKCRPSSYTKIRN